MMLDFADTWATLTRPSDGLTARPHPGSGGVWLALDSDGRRHLLVRATDAEPNQMLMATTRGLRAMTVLLSVEQEAEDVWTDISCLDPALNETFVKVADNLAEEVRSSPNEQLAAVRRTLRTWQWFWGIDPSNLSGEKALGLFGELWFIDRWAPFPEIIDSWFGPVGHRHDFSTTEISVEVKATQVLSDGPSRHRITSLDQLAPPETGSLYLFSLQLIRDPNAGNTLPGLIARVRARLASRPDLIGVLDQRLGQAGWSPAHADLHTQPYRIGAEELYRVNEGFPRLIRESFVGGIPVGVDDIVYTLDLAACKSWRVAAQPAQAVEILANLKP
jgi:hypothetical protein